MAGIAEILTRYSADIDATMQEMLAEAPEFIHGMISYHIGWVDQDFQPARAERGKMLRPTLHLLVFEALSGRYEAALPVAAAIEMIHNFSLIHDDIEDNDYERRGRPTAWSIWGKPRVINGGDFLYSLAFKSMYRLEGRFPPERVFAVLRLIVQACLELTKGQDLDLGFEAQPVVSTDRYLDMIQKKTGALIEASIGSGAILGTDHQPTVDNYRTFAHNIGLAFQVRDDVLGIWGDKAKTGKSTANDIRRKKKTLPIIYTLDRCTGDRQQQLQTYYTQPDPLTDAEVDFVRESLEWADAYTYAQGVATRYRDEAFAALHAIDLANEPQAQLETLTKFLIDRSY